MLYISLISLHHQESSSFIPQMIVTDIYNHRFHRIFATNENLSSIMERDDIYVWVSSLADKQTII